MLTTLLPRAAAVYPGRCAVIHGGRTQHCTGPGDEDDRRPGCADLDGESPADPR